MTVAAFWRAWSIWAVAVAATAAGLVDRLLYPLPPKLAAETGSPADGVVAIVFIGASATVGALLAWKRPANPIGWLLSGTGLAYATGVFGGVLMHFAGTRALASWLGWTWFAGIALAVYVVLLFPTGALPSPRCRPTAWGPRAPLSAPRLGTPSP